MTDTRFTTEEYNAMESWIREHYHFGKLPIPGDMVKAFLIMKSKGENKHLFQQLAK